jgi:hypothetical protein
MARIPDQKVRVKRINVKALVYAVAGPEPAYPVYQFSRRRTKVERPGHNPFSTT